MNGSTCRWGILSAAAIARKNWKAIRLSGNGCVAAVASRDKSRAQAFIDECEREVPMVQPAEPVEGYDALLARDDIDAVYIPVPTGLRKEWVIEAAAAGKHVLCEKPAGVNATDVAEMLDACRQSGVQFMDGVMFDHSGRLEGIRQSIGDAEKFGRLRRIQTHFSFLGDTSFRSANIRVDARLEPHGCLGDLGWYCIRFTLWATGGKLPTTVSARTITPLSGNDSGGDVPGEFTAELQFDDDVSAGFYCSFLTSNQQTAVLSGEHGYVTIDDFVLPFYDAELKWTENQHVLEVANCRWNFGRHRTTRAVREYAAGEANSQEVNMVRRFAEIVLSGEIDPRYPRLTLQTQQVLDACRRSAVGGGERVSVET